MKSILLRFSFLLTLAIAAAAYSARGEAMLELFNVSWSDITKKMPEIAEAGYDSIWIPPPARASNSGGNTSVGYDSFDPFDLGDNSPTRWGTTAQLQTLVLTAHRFGIRIYMDNIMNHRGFTVPGANSSTSTNFYPGLIPQDFHLQTSGNYYVNTIGIADWGITWDIQNESLEGLVDLANEPGSINLNFGSHLGAQITKPSFIRHPGQNQYYMDSTKPAIEGSPWHPFNGTNGVPVAEDVNSYLIRAVMYELNATKCDGFRMDAVKEVPSGFFGDTTATFNGYCGAIQAMFDCVHGYGANVVGNGYLEADDNRNSFFNPEAPRNDAFLFGEAEYMPSDGGESYGDYISRGMRLINFDLRGWMNSALSGGSLSGLEQPGPGAIDPRQGVQFADNQDDAEKYGYTNHREMQDAYYLMHEGEASIYSDGYNQSTATPPQTPFPSVASANYLGEYGDNQMPDICYLHNQLARGYTTPRWGSTAVAGSPNDQYCIAFERYDYREGSSSSPQTQVVSLFVMNDNYGYPGDITFDDAVGQTYDGYYGGISISNSKNQGLAVGFAPGSVLVQLASSSPTSGRAYSKLLVHAATTSLSAAQASVNNADPTQRLIYVGSQNIPSGGGAIELNVPSGSWVIYGYQWPEASRANVSTNAIILKQGGVEVPHITVTRTDGVNGDTNYNPSFPFKMRGSVDPLGNVIGGVHVSNLTYAIDVPIVTNGNFDIISRSDASCVNTLIKLDGGIDLNSQMGLGVTNLNGRSSDGYAPTNFLDLRDNKPGYASDVFLGYEQAAFQFRNNPEKFAAKNTLSNNIISLGAETYYFTIGGTNQIISGAGIGQAVDQTAAFVYHDPADVVTATGNSQANQRVPFAPASGQSADVYVKIGYTNYFNTCYLYYTTDGSNPEGAFGVGKGTTKSVLASFVAGDASASTIQWYKATIPGQSTATQVRYKVGAYYAGGAPISDGDSTGAKLYGLTQMAVTNFNPTTAVVWLHNDLNPVNTVTGLQSGFHIVRARTFLPRTNQSSVYNTFLQTFYYDGALPQGVIAYPPTDGYTITTTTYTVVVRADSTVTEVDYNIQDSLNTNTTFYVATNVSPNSAISALYPNYPQEFRFTYTNIPTSGTGTITVRLKEFASGVYTNRYTTLTRTVIDAAPAQVVQISSPATDGAILTNSLNSTYLVQACFTTALGSSKSNFNVLINGALQSQANYIITPGQLLTSSFCPGMRALQYNWSNPTVGTNVIQVIYTNTSSPNVTGQPISDTRTVIVAPPLVISGFTGAGSGSQTVIWDSAAGAVYQIWATTNLAQPFQNISGPISGNAGSTFFYDTDTNAQQKFYEVQMVQ